MRKVILTTLSAIAGLLITASVYADMPDDWSMYNFDATGSRHNTKEKTLDVSNVANADILWTVYTAGAVSGTPAVAGHTVYVGDWNGDFYALSESDGSQIWKTSIANAKFSASPLVIGNKVVIGDQASGKVYGLDRKTGAIAWTTVLDPHPLASVWGSATQIGDNFAIGVASNEEGATQDKSYPCCSTRGSLALVDPNDGAIIWQTPTITDTELAAGTSGSSIWTTPSYDKKLNLIYAATGNNFSQPTNGTSDAMIAFNADTGAIVWINQRTEDDEWNFRFLPSDEHPDFDFGDSIQVYKLSNGRKVVGAGQKSGFYHTLDAATGEEVLAPEQVETPGLLGGLFSDSGIADGVIYANGIDWSSAGYDPNEIPNGHVFARSADTLEEIWTFETPFSINWSGVAIANGVVYFTSAFNWNLYGLDAATGIPVLTLNLGAPYSGAAIGSGPSISGGRIFVGGGDAFAAAYGFPNSGRVMAIGLQ